MHVSRLQQISPTPSVTKFQQTVSSPHTTRVSPTDRHMEFVSKRRSARRRLSVTGFVSSRSSYTGRYLERFLRNRPSTSVREVAFRQMDPAPKCPYSQGCHYKWISGETQHSVPPTPSLLPWSCSLRLLPVPATEENNEKSPIRWRWEIQAYTTRQMRATKISDYQRCFRQRQERCNKCI